MHLKYEVAAGVQRCRGRLFVPGREDVHGPLWSSPCVWKYVSRSIRGSRVPLGFFQQQKNCLKTIENHSLTAKTCFAHSCGPRSTFWYQICPKGRWLKNGTYLSRSHQKTLFLVHWKSMITDNPLPLIGFLWITLRRKCTISLVHMYMKNHVLWHIPLS